MMASSLLFIAVGSTVAEYPTPSSLPPHSWDTVGQKTFIHGCKAEGPLNASELALAARFPLLTVEKGQGVFLPGRAEEKMAAVSQQYKGARPDGWSIFYSNSYFDWEMYQLHEKILQHPEVWLVDPVTDEPCRVRGDKSFPQPDDGMLVFNMSNAEMRQLFVDECRNATEAGFDGCFIDCANVWAKISKSCAENPAGKKCCHQSSGGLSALAAGAESLMQELQAAVTTDRLIIAKDGGNDYGDARFVNALFLSDSFCGSNACQAQMEAGLAAAQRGQIVLAHGQVGSKASLVEREEHLRFTLAAFLVIAEDTSFFSFSEGWYYNGTSWHPEFDLPLGPPLAPASVDEAGVWRRQFGAGVRVTVDVDARNASIEWGNGTKLV